MQLRRRQSLKLALRNGSQMLKRVHSHMKVRKPAFLEVGGLSTAHRSKSLTQIDCLDGGVSAEPRRSEDRGGLEGPCPPMVRRDDLVRSEPETSPSPCSSPSAGAQHRIHRLPHKMPSQEMFSVSFDEWDKPGNYELLPASKGVLLKEALMTHLERRGIEAANINVFLDSSNTPLSLQFETFRLGGNHLHVRTKEPPTSVACSQLDGLPITRANSTGSYPLVCTGATPSVGQPSHYPMRLPASRSNSSSSKEQEKARKSSSASSQSVSKRRNALQSSEDLTLCGASSDGAAGVLLPGVDPHAPDARKSKGRSGLARKPGIFSSFKTDMQERENKMELLSELLNQYSQEGVPEMRGLLTFGPTPGSPRGPQDPESETPDDPFYLEKEWSQFVMNAQDLSKRTRNQQNAIWELLHTEVFYIRRLKVITDLILACLCNLQSEGILNEIDTEKMFSNVTEIYAANTRFWTEHLLPMLKASRQSGEPLQPTLIKEAFLKFDHLFQSYSRYCLEHQSCLQYVKDKQKENEHFKTFVVWCETRKDCDRLKLVDLLVKPVQRLTKYSLLLKAIQKKTDDDVTRDDLQQMNDCVETFVCNVDATMRQKHEQERLSSIIDRIESYDPVDVNNDELERALKEHCVLDLTCPMPGCGNQQSRQLLLEGSGLKLRETSSSKVDVHCFLFTDMLLLCKGRKGDKVRVIRQPYVVERLVVNELKDGSGLLLVYLNEYRVAVAAFILYTPEHRLWSEHIRKAQEQYREARSAASAIERPQLGFLRPAAAEEEDEDGPSTALLVQQGRSARSSSRSSLVHSHSGSVDMSDPASAASSTCVPPPVSSPVSQGKAVSIELGELRNSSLSSDDGSDLAKMRSSSMETRVSVTVTSPRPERRAFLLKGGAQAAPLGSSVASGSLSLSVPCLGEVTYDGATAGARDGGPMTSPNSPTTIQVPVIPPPSKNLCLSARLPSPLSRPLQRTPPSSAKPPLVKTKNVSGLVTHSAPPGEPPCPVHGELSPPPPPPPLDPTSEDEVNRRLNVKRACRTERRYHTADSIENLKKKEKDTSIHKRLSWNCGQQMSGGEGSLSPCGPSERLLRNKHVSGRCLSSESVYSSSGVSSTGSVHLSQGSGEYDPEVLRIMMMEEETGCDFVVLPDVGESATDDQAVEEEDGYDYGGRDDQERHQAEDEEDRLRQTAAEEEALSGRIKIDVSEVKEGISSVQIRVNGGAPLQQAGKASKDDLVRLKQFLLNSRSVEASEV